LNAWFGSHEATVKQIDAVVPRVTGCDDVPTFRFGLRLDHVFARFMDRSFTVESCAVRADTMGSDHHPIVMLVR
jgi:endonuclease/exonuclease/phosphatase (EEP) superfamily protein YafD